MQFKLADFYTILIELAFSSLFLIIFCSIHYSIHNIKKVRDTLEKKKPVNFIYFFIFGAGLSSLSFVVSQLCAKTLGTTIGLPVIVLGLVFTMSFFYGIAVQVGALVPSVVWIITYYATSGTNANWEMIMRLIVIGFYFLVSLALWLLKEKKTLYFFLATILVSGTIVLTISCINDAQFLYHTLEASLNLLFALLFLGIIKYINRIFTNIANIAISSVYADNHYLVPESFEINFNNYVKQNKINQALVILFEFNETNNAQAKQELLNNIYLAFNKDEYKPMFFKNEYNKYGIVLCSKHFYINDLNQSFKGNMFPNRLSNDNLLTLQNILNSIPLKYKIGNNKIQFSLKAYASIYGVHSYDINELLNNNMFMINNEDLTNSNVVKIFHSDMVGHISADSINYAQLIQNINLDEISVSLELIQMNHDKSLYVLPRIYWMSKMLGTYKAVIDNFSNKIAATLLRHLAMKSLELYTQSKYNGKYKIIIVYPLLELDSQFYSLSNTLQKIKLLGINPKDVVFNFDASNITTWTKDLLNHLDEFESKDVKYIILNVNNPSILNTHKPMFVTFGKDVLNNSTKLSKANKISKKQNINVL